MAVNKERDKYLREMREYWLETRGSGIQGTTVFIPANFNERVGEYYDKNIDSNTENQEK